jgi:hypothetical protein
VTIPANINGLPVTGIGGYAFFECTSLTSVTIPDTVTSIAIEAFYGCTGLTNVTIGNGVASIGYFAFSHCSSLTSVAIGNGVTYIVSGCLATPCSSVQRLIGWPVGRAPKGFQAACLRAD